MFQLEIPKRSLHCFNGGELLHPGTEYYSALFRGENENVCHRHDYCLACWNKSDCHSEVGQISSWKSVVPQKKDGSDLPKKRDERALYLLKKALCEPENNHSIAEAFVLALYLARRRLIVLRQEMIMEGKPPLCIYEVRDTEEMVCVPKIPISELEIEKLQMELAKKFNA
jgi:hypothetical protein